ncbi:MAG TPA: alpha/beta fold hydrolase [Gemmatimonadaceae bacterium]|nr:alpha/beta fold hydrolase [Gemmatimonadaceae bacterium]
MTDESDGRVHGASPEQRDAREHAHSRDRLDPLEHHIVIPRTARYYTLGRADAAVEQLWLVCHGYSQLASRFITYFNTLVDARRCIVAPEALSRFYLDASSSGTHATARVGASWMTREDRLHEIDDQAHYLDAVIAEVRAQLAHDPSECVVLGFSQGAATAARWAVRTSMRVDRLVLWGGLLPPDLDLAIHGPRLARMQLTLVAGSRDEYIAPAMLDAETARIERAGVPCARMMFDGGHRLDRTVLRALAEDAT